MAINLQKVALVLRKVWALSVAADMATHMGTSYLDVRVRLCWSMAVLYIHLLAIPMHDRHTGEIMFDTMASVMMCCTGPGRRPLLACPLMAP